MTPTTLNEHIVRLKQGTVVPRPDDEDWTQMIDRTGIPGRISQVDGETYDYFLDVLPPRWMGIGGGFAFAEGDEALRLFWAANTAEGRMYFCRQLTDEETNTFCRLARISRSS
jgi:hypothetical protein